MDARTDNHTADPEATRSFEPFEDLRNRNVRRARIAKLLATQRERRRLTIERVLQVQREHRHRNR